MKRMEAEIKNYELRIEADGVLELGGVEGGEARGWVIPAQTGIQANLR